MSSLVPAIGAKHSMKCSLGLWDQRWGVRSCSCYRGQTLNDAFSVFWDQRRGLKRLIPNWGRDGETCAAAVGARCLRLAELSQPSGLDCGSCRGGPGHLGPAELSQSSWLSDGSEWYEPEHHVRHGSISEASSNVARKGFERPDLGVLGPSPLGAWSQLCVCVVPVDFLEKESALPVRSKGLIDDVCVTALGF